MQGSWLKDVVALSFFFRYRFITTTIRITATTTTKEKITPKITLDVTMATRFSASLLDCEAVGISCVDISATMDAFNKYTHSGIRMS